MKSSGDPVISVAETIDNLAAKSDAELYNVAIDPDIHEDSRAEAIGLLSKRENSSSIEQLIGLLKERDVPAEVRRVTLQAIVDNRIYNALPTLLWLCNEIGPEHDGLALVFLGYSRESLLRARSSLGDITVSRDLICLYYLGGPPAWPLRTLIEQLGGMPAVVGQLTSSSGSMEEQLRLLAMQDEDARIRRWSIDRLTEVAEYQPIDLYVEK